MAVRNIHTVFDRGKKRWVNKQQNNPRPLSSHLTKETAVGEGRRIAKRNKVEHIIHYQAGPIQRRNSYGNDPFPPKN